MRLTPGSSSDRNVPRFTWTGPSGGLEWLEFHFPGPQRVGSAEVYWADDTGGPGRCRLPIPWRIFWWDGQDWQPAAATSAYETVKDRFSRVRFTPVETTAVRLRAELAPRGTAGIYEWRVDK